MVGENGIPETPEWSLPIARVWAIDTPPAVTLATAEIDSFGTE